MKRCLIVVDFQNDFISGSLGIPKSIELASAIAEKIKKYRQNGDDIIFTLDTHGDDYLNTQEGKNLPVPHCIKGTDGHKLHPKIESLRLPSDVCFEKTTFGSAELFDYLRMNLYSSIELCGLVSNICVLSNAVICKTAQPETQILVDPRCTGCFDEKMNEAALLVMQSIQIKLSGLEEETL